MNDYLLLHIYTAILLIPQWKMFLTPIHSKYWMCHLSSFWGAVFSSPPSEILQNEGCLVSSVKMSSLLTSSFKLMSPTIGWPTVFTDKCSVMGLIEGLRATKVCGQKHNGAYGECCSLSSNEYRICCPDIPSVGIRLCIWKNFVILSAGDYRLLSLSGKTFDSSRPAPFWSQLFSTQNWDPF